MTVGIIGVGHLMKHMVPALVKSGQRFVLSPRGRENAAALSRAYGLEIMADNGAIVAASDLIILAVRPYDALDVATPLSWRAGQTVLSVCAGVDNNALAKAVAPARLCLAMPVPAAEFGESATVLYPADAACEALLAHCGAVIGVDEEALFTRAAVFGCYYGWVHALIGEMTDWARAQGLGEDQARLLAAQMTRAAATSVRQRKGVEIADLVGELATPRSFTALGLEVLRARDAFAPWREASERIRSEYDKA
jgi:pyrroline-5-carboxylate reductase